MDAGTLDHFGFALSVLITCAYFDKMLVSVICKPPKLCLVVWIDIAAVVEPRHTPETSLGGHATSWLVWLGISGSRVVPLQS